MKKYSIYFDFSLQQEIKRFAYHGHRGGQYYSIILQLPNIWNESLEFNDFVQSISYFTFQELTCFLSNRILNYDFNNEKFCKNFCIFKKLANLLIDEKII